jgi:hypothetical protein
MKDRPFVTLAKELNYVMSGAHEVPKDLHVGTENAGPEEQMFTVVVYDQGGRTVLFRQIAGYSAAGVLTQYTEQVSSGNPDYGKDTTDESSAPFYRASGVTP